MSKKYDCYTIEDGQVVNASYRQWRTYMTNEQFIMSNRVNGHRVSTIFIGVRDNLYETIIFLKNGEQIEYERYLTEQDAIDGHHNAMNYALGFDTGEDSDDS